MNNKTVNCTGINKKFTFILCKNKIQINSKHFPHHPVMQYNMFKIYLKKIHLFTIH